MNTPVTVFHATEKCAHCQHPILGESDESQTDAEVQATYAKQEHEDGCPKNPENAATY